MEGQNPHPAYPVVSALSIMIAWTIKDVQVYASLFGTLVAIVSGILAIRYYWLAGNEKKKKLKNL